MPRPTSLEKTIKTADHALALLAKADAKLARVIEKAPPFRLEIPHLQTPFEALAESIVYQQLSGKAAASIFNRLKIVTNETDFPTPDEILALPEATLRAVGLSRAKTLAIIDLAAKTKDGLIPTAEAMQKMADDELVERLTAVRGIGRWTVEMILIFRLGRLDVMPATDYGVRKGFALTYKLTDLPSPAQVIAHAERWRPYRTIASWYMWRAIDIFKTVPASATKTAVKISAAKAAVKTAAKKAVKTTMTKNAAKSAATKPASKITVGKTSIKVIKTAASKGR